MVSKPVIRRVYNLKDIILFRWHLGTEQKVEIEQENQVYIITWADGILKLKNSQPLVVLQEKMADQSLIPRDWDDPSPDHLHTVIVVHTKTAANTLKLSTGIYSTSEPSTMEILEI